MFCVERRSSDSRTLRKESRNISWDIWKPYTEKNAFILLGQNKDLAFSWQEFLRLGSRGATVRLCGRMLEAFKRGDYTNPIEHNGLPRPHGECIVGPNVKTCMFKKRILKTRKFSYAGRCIVRTFLPLPPPPPIARRDM